MVAGQSMGTFAAITDERTGRSKKHVCCRKVDVQLNMLSMFDIAVRDRSGGWCVLVFGIGL